MKRKFSQRQGYRELPPQLRLGEVSKQFMNQVQYAIEEQLEYVSSDGMYGTFFTEKGARDFKSFCVLELGLDAQTAISYSDALELVRKFCQNTSKFPTVFDLIEHIIERGPSPRFIPAISDAFVRNRLAYRLRGDEIIAVGSEEGAAAFERADRELGESGLNGAQSHLVKAARRLAEGSFGDSVRESISSVESVARMIGGKKSTLGSILSKLEKGRHVHSAMSSAFAKLYGYTSDEQGIRHSLLDEGIAPVSEAEALFMLTACSAFVSYLLSQQSLIQQN